MSTPHPDQETIIVRCAIITVSDTRTPESDRSGQLIQRDVEKDSPSSYVGEEFSTNK